MTAIEIIDETVEYYTHNPQAISLQGTCEYRTENGNMCVVGRCMRPEVAAEFQYVYGAFDGDDFRIAQGTRTTDDLLQPRYHGHQDDFWATLQELHDFSSYWGAVGEGLTEAGQTFLTALRNKWGEPDTLDYGQSFESPHAAAELVLSFPEDTQIDELMKFVRANIDMGEFGFASELVAEFGNRC